MNSRPIALRVIGLLAAAAAFGNAALIAAGEQKDYPIRPVPFTQVRVNDAFWLPRLETNRTVTIPFLFQKNEETGRIDNFAIAGGLIQGKYKGERYNDTDVYKPIEGAAYSLMVHPDPALDRALDEVIANIAAAQEPDGYLFTARTCDPAHPRPGIGPERWVEETVSHELYNAGHLYEAAVAHFLATGKRSLLDVALKNADLVASVFGPDKRHGFPGHQEIELALVKLYRVTGREKYLDLAKYFLDQRGREVRLTQYPPGSRFAIYNDPRQIQAHKPVLEQDEAVGHAGLRGLVLQRLALAVLEIVPRNDGGIGGQRLARGVPLVVAGLFLCGDERAERDDHCQRRRDAPSDCRRHGHASE